MCEDRSIFHENEVRSKSRNDAVPTPASTLSFDQTPERIAPNPPVQRSRRPRYTSASIPTPEPAPVPNPAPVPPPDPPTPAAAPPRQRRRSEAPGRRWIAVAAIGACVALMTLAMLMTPAPDAVATVDPEVPSFLPAPTPTPELFSVAVQPTPEVVYIEATPEIVYVEATPEIIYVTPAPTAVPAAAAEYVRASGDVYIRTGPARHYKSIGVLKNGRRAEYLGQCSLDERGVAWYYVRCSGHTGWVSSRYSRIE